MASIMASPALLVGCLGSQGTAIKLMASALRHFCNPTLLRSSFSSWHRGKGGPPNGERNHQAASTASSPPGT
jgi:hypothetical protein